MTRNRYRPPASSSPPIGVLNVPAGLDTSTWGPVRNYDLLRPLLVNVDHPDVRGAVANYDAAVAHRRRLDGTRPTPAADVEAAYRAEQTAAATERRPATISWTAVQTAQAAEQDYTAAAHAADVAIGAANSRLGETIAPRDGSAGAAIGALLHTVAAERARLIAAGLDPAHPLGGLYRLHTLVRWPVTAYVPALLSRAGGMIKWWPLVLGVGMGPLVTGGAGEQAEARLQWNEWAWARLAMRKARGFHVGDDGVLAFREAWRPPTPRPPRGYEPGMVVMVGDGPNGERGADLDDAHWLPGHVRYG